MRLCDSITQPRKRCGVYTSRWKLVLSAYNSVRARLLNSQALLESTNLQLYTINEATLVSICGFDNPLYDNLAP